MSSLKDDLKMRWATGGMAVRLVMFNVLVFLILTTLRLLTGLGLPLPALPGAFGLATSADPAILMFRPWSVVTHMFAHTEVWHLAMNMLILWWMGGMFRGYFGDRRTLSTYLMGGLSGFVLYVVATNLVPSFPQGGYALGASGGDGVMVATATFAGHRDPPVPHRTGQAQVGGCRVCRARLRGPVQWQQCRWPPGPHRRGGLRLLHAGCSPTAIWGRRWSGSSIGW